MKTKEEIEAKIEELRKDVIEFKKKSKDNPNNEYFREVYRRSEYTIFQLKWVLNK